jgi:hypothetical protein
MIGYLQKLLYTVNRIRMSPTPTLNIYLFEGPILSSFINKTFVLNGKLYNVDSYYVIDEAFSHFSRSLLLGVKFSNKFFGQEFCFGLKDYYLPR